MKKTYDELMKAYEEKRQQIKQLKLLGAHWDSDAVRELIKEKNALLAEAQENFPENTINL